MTSRLVSSSTKLVAATLGLALASSVTVFASPQSAVLAELEAFKARFGHRMVVSHHDSGYVKMIHSGEMRLDSVPRTDAEYEAAARSLFNSFPGLFGYDADALDLVKVWRPQLARIGSTDKVGVLFRQSIEGVEAWAAWATVLFDLNGRILSIDNFALPGLQSRDDLFVPSIDEGDAVTFASQAFGMHVQEVLSTKFMIHRDSLGQGQPAWMVELLATEDRDGVPIQKRFAVDAHSGEILSTQDTVYTVDLIGNVEGWASPGDAPDTGSNPEVIFELPDVRMTSSVGDAESINGGDFTISYGGNNNQNVTASFPSSATRVHVNDESGAEISLTQNVTPGVPSTFTLNSSRTEADTAEVNAQRWTSIQQRWIKSLDPNDNTMEFRMTANVNQNNCCNAFFNGSSTNYFEAGCGCVNTSYSSVVLHENGHWCQSRYTPASSGAMHEGIADVWSMYILDEAIVGRDFCGPGCHVRNGNNGTMKCDGCSENCHGGQVHREGEVIMGAFWRMRDRLNGTHGDAAGDDIADNLFLAWLQVYDDFRLCDEIYTHILILDDDDGNITNGTPHCLDIQGAFEVDKGWPDINDCEPSQDCPDNCDVPANYGTGTAGTGGITPRITYNNGCPYINNQNFEVVAENALGGASGSLIIGFSSDNTDGGGWTLYVQPHLIIPVDFDGAGAGNGSNTFHLPIPNNPFIVGLQVYFQYTVSDPGAPFGVAATDGMRIELCSPQ